MIELPWSGISDAALYLLNALYRALRKWGSERRKPCEQPGELTEEQLSELSELSEQLNEVLRTEWSELVRKSFVQIVDAGKWELLEKLAVEVYVRTPNRALGELTAEAIREFAAAPASYREYLLAAALIEALNSRLFSEVRKF